MNNKTSIKEKSKIKTRMVNPSLNIEKIDTLLLILFSLSISILLFLRGGYFERELLPGIILIYSVFMGFLYVCLKYKIINLFDNPIDILLFGICIMYLLSIAYGVNKRASVIETTKHLAFFAIYVIAKYLSKDKKLEDIILNIIISGGFLVSIIGVGAVIGSWEVVGAVFENRLSSTLQYPNTLAVYVTALYFLGITLIINKDNKLWKTIYAFFAGTFLFALIITFSRAMWLMFPFVILLYFITIPNKRKMEAFIYILGSAIFSLPASFLFARSMSEPSPKLWVYFIIASIGTALLMYLLSLGEKLYRRISIKKLLIALLLLTSAIAYLIIYAANQTTEIKLENTTAETRTTTFYRNISNTLPGTSYILQFDYSGENNSNASNIGTIQINNMDNKGNTTPIIRENIVESNGTNSINFTTNEDSMGIIVYFQNTQPKTSVIIKSARIIDENTNQVITDIPLKYKYIPETIITRISSINTGESSLLARMRFNIDGLKIIKDYPIVGTGGGGWVALYQKYQSYPYWTSLAHNYFLQLWIELGTVGLILLLSVIVISSYFAFRTYKKSEDIEFKVLLAGLFIIIFTMLLHAFVDFDMSLGAYAIVFWTFVGIIVANIKFDNAKLDKYVSKLNFINSKPIIYLIEIICIILIINSFNILSSGKYMKLAAEANDREEIDGVIENFEKASIRDKLKPTIKIDLANAYKLKYSMTGDLSYIEKAIELTNNYLKLAPTDSNTQAYGAQFYISIGQFDKGIELLEKSIELQPLRAENYIQKLDGYLSIFQYNYEKGDKDYALVFLKNALLVKKDIQDVSKKSFKLMETNYDLVKTIGEVEYLYNNYDDLDEIKTNVDSITFAYYFDLDINNDGDIDMLYSSIPEGSKIQHQSMTESEENFIRIANEGEVYGFKYIYPLSLEPNTTYVVELKARGNTRPETFNLYAWSNGSADPNQGNLLGIELTDDWQTYSFEFKTDQDVEPGKQYIRIQHNGNDAGYIDIKDLVIFSR